jgi:hypothetical protein
MQTGPGKYQGERRSARGEGGGIISPFVSVISDVNSLSAADKKAAKRYLKRV